MYPNKCNKIKYYLLPVWRGWQWNIASERASNNNSGGCDLSHHPCWRFSFWWWWWWWRWWWWWWQWCWWWWWWQWWIDMSWWQWYWWWFLWWWSSECQCGRGVNMEEEARQHNKVCHHNHNFPHDHCHHYHGHQDSCHHCDHHHHYHNFHRCQHHHHHCRHCHHRHHYDHYFHPLLIISANMKWYQVDRVANTNKERLKHLLKNQKNENYCENNLPKECSFLRVVKIIVRISLHLDESGWMQWYGK